MLRAVLIDLDETLYEPNSGLIRTIDLRITAFIALHAGLAWGPADALRRVLWRDFGTTARGLNFHFDRDERDLNRFAIDSVDPAEHVRPDPALDQALSRIPAPCYVFTNGPRRYAERVLRALGVGHRFSGIFAIEFAHFHPKPAPLFYRKALERLRLPADQVALVEDNARNVEPALHLGMRCVLVGSRHAPPGAVSVRTFAEVPEALAALPVRS